MARVLLGTWPTPLEPAPRLGPAIGLGTDDLWIKRDDLCGPGGGGNKVRKLEYICGEAQAAGATALVTTGAAQSNHARLTAAAGARLGLDVHLVLAGDGADVGDQSGNLVLDGWFGASIHWAGAMDVAVLERQAARVAASLPAAYLVPYGGSSGTSIRGYVDCADELVGQAPDLAQVVTAVGSGGTMAGLVTGLGPARVLGIHTGAVADPAVAVTALLAAPPGDPLRLRLDQVGAGYSTLTPAVADALALAARHEGLVLDPVYTGRALAGLVAAVADGSVIPGQRTILLHTGGLPGLFGHPEAVRAGLAGLRISPPSSTA